MGPTWIDSNTWIDAGFWDAGSSPPVLLGQACM